MYTGGHPMDLWSESQVDIGRQTKCKKICARSMVKDVTATVKLDYNRFWNRNESTDDSKIG